MNKFTKLAVLCSLSASLGLVACQSNMPLHQKDESTMQKEKEMKPHHMPKHEHMTEQQRQSFDEQVKKSCMNNIGNKTSFTINDKTIQGTCEVRFKPNMDMNEKMDMMHHDMHDKMEHMKNKMGDMKDKVKDKMKDFNMTEKERAEHEQQRMAMQKACENKVGQKVTFNIDGKTVEGTCELALRPEKPKMTHILQ